MKQLESKQPSRVEKAKGVISRAEERIEREFEKTSNSWLECFGSSIFVVETYLDSDKVREEFGDNKFNTMLQKLNTLKERHAELKVLYPDKQTIPPDVIKKELLLKLNILE